MGNNNNGLVSREQLLSALYEAAELEHNLMCTYLYAAFTLRSGEAEGLSKEEVRACLPAVERSSTARLE